MKKHDQCLTSCKVCHTKRLEKILNICEDLHSCERGFTLHGVDNHYSLFIKGLATGYHLGNKLSKLADHLYQQHNQAYEHIQQPDINCIECESMTFEMYEMSLQFWLWDLTGN